MPTTFELLRWEFEGFLHSLGKPHFTQLRHLLPLLMQVPLILVSLIISEETGGIRLPRAYIKSNCSFLRRDSVSPKRQPE